MLMVDSTHPDIMQMTFEELKSRCALEYETFAPFYVCSYALHAFNIVNQKRKVYWENKKIPNLRLHNIFIAPPGGMKSFYLFTMGADENAIFANTNYAMNLKGNLNEGSIVGSFTPQGGKIIPRIGEFQKHSNEFICIDEFRALTDAMKSNFNNQLGTQLLNILDHGNVVKDLVGGPTISFKTCATLWGGVQPARYSLEDGMGRRLCFLFNIPTKEQSDALGEAVWKSKNIRFDEEKASRLTEEINDWTSTFDTINRIDFDRSIYDYYKQCEFEAADFTLYDRLILGYHLSRGNIDSSIELDIEDKELYDILECERKWREEVQRGPHIIQIADLIKVYGFQNGEDDSKHYINISKLNQLCVKIKMSIPQIHEKIEEMKKWHLITVISKDLLCYEGP